MKKIAILLLLFIPGFIFSKHHNYLDNWVKARFLKENHPNLVEQYNQVRKAYKETREYKKYKEAKVSYVSDVGSNLMSRPQAFKHFVFGALPFENVVSGDLVLGTFERNCYESAGCSSSWEDCETRECKLYHEMSKLHKERKQKLQERLNMAHHDAKHTDEGLEFTRICMEIENAFNVYKEYKKSQLT